MRHMIALTCPIAATIRDFLARAGDDPERDAMPQGWFNAVVVQVALWARPDAGKAW